MHLQAFTNFVGDYSLKQEKTAYQYGRYFGNYNVYEVYRSDTIAVERSIKPAPIKGKFNPGGNYLQSRNYTRSVRKVLSDSPALWFRYSYNPPIELWHHVYISVLHTPFSYVPSNPKADNARARSVTTALNKLVSNKVGIGADVAEGKQVVDMLGGSVASLAKALLALKRLDFPGFVRALGLDPRSMSKSQGRTVSSLWLQYSYGWKPLMSDIFDSQALAHSLLQKGQSLEGKSTQNAEFVEHFDYQGQLHDCKSQVSYRTVVRAHVDNPLWANLNMFGLANPLAIAWELIPWSFAIDWLVPVGKTLEACTASVGLVSDGGFTSIHDYSEVGITMKNSYDTKTGQGYVEPGEYREAMYTFSRVAFADFPMPQFYANENPYSTNRALNALALLRQLA